MTKNEKKLRRAMYASLNAIVSSNEKIAKAYGKQSIPLSVLKETIKQGYFKAPEGSEKEVKELEKKL